MIHVLLSIDSSLLANDSFLAHSFWTRYKLHNQHSCISTYSGSRIGPEDTNSESKFDL
jgi:hypothetical protein